MRIVFSGRVSLTLLAQDFEFDRTFPKVRWGFDIGSKLVVGLVKRDHEVHVVTEHTVEKIETFRVSSFKFQDSGCGKLIVHLVPSRKRSRLGRFAAIL